jgi:hypothetical protein
MTRVDEELVSKRQQLGMNNLVNLVGLLGRFLRVCRWLHQGGT